MNFQWSLQSAAPEAVQALSRQLQIPELLARLLIQRGFECPERSYRFLNPRLEDLFDPYLMKGMREAVERIQKALSLREKILIYGDYDVDGITSTVVLRRALEMLGGEVDFHIPERLQEGYGVRKEIIEKAWREGYRLVITADSGVRAFEACETARNLRLDLIITDHHLPADALPEAFAILNPRRLDCGYPEKNLAAVGVVFKLVQALFAGAGKSHLVHHFLKLVAIGTIADIVPLTGENRIIVRYGLDGLADPRNIGLRALLAGVGMDKAVDWSDIGFRLAPRINAVTRMGGGREVVDLFSTADTRRAQAIVSEMNQKNSQRQQEEQRVLDQIEARFLEDPQTFDRHFLVVSGQDWHRGVIGIVASRLAERFYRPALVMSVSEDRCQGSGRSIPGFHLLRALESASDLFESYGGHAQAVGCTLRRDLPSSELLRQLQDRLESHARDHLRPEDLVPVLSIDSVLTPQELSLSLYEQIQQLAPFGLGNPVPIFASKGVGVMGGPWILKEKHLKFRVASPHGPTDAIWWKNADAADRIAAGSELDIAYTLTRNYFQGEEKLLLTIQDLHA